MINVQVRGTDTLAKKSSQLLPALEQGKIEFIENHVRNNINIQGYLIRELNRLVYSSPNEWYERTGALKRAIRVERSSDGLRVYMDGDYLEQASQTPYTKRTGLAKNAKGIDYSWAVETGFVYQNNYRRDVEENPKPFMANTWAHLLNQLDLNVIMRPVRGVW